MPAGWKERLVPIRSDNTGGATGPCIDVNDLAVSKLIAGRENDLRFVTATLRHGLVSAGTLRERVAQTTLDEARRRLCLMKIEEALRKT